MLASKKYMILMHFGLALGEYKYSFSITEVCYQLYEGVIRDVYGIRSLAECSILCTEDNCCSLVFDKTSHRCITYSGFANSTVTGCGWKYAEIDLDFCRGPRPYTPTGPNLCEPGYSYDASDNKCRINCPLYGSTYGTFEGYALGEFNDVSLSGSSEQACNDACTTASFGCRTAEMHTDGTCYLSVETALTQPEMFGQWASFTHWQRNCV